MNESHDEQARSEYDERARRDDHESEASVSEPILTANQWAIMVTIRVQPDYQFTGSEKRSADVMTKRGLLKPLSGKRYAITARGLKEYRRAV